MSMGGSVGRPVVRGRGEFRPAEVAGPDGSAVPLTEKERRRLEALAAENRRLGKAIADANERRARIAREVAVLSARVRACRKLEKLSASDLEEMARLFRPADADAGGEGGEA